MPDPTTHFGWDVPTVGGDTGAWGTILNNMFDTIDADLRANAGKPSEQLSIPAILGDGVGWVPNDPAGHIEMARNVTGSDTALVIPINERLRVGQTITQFAVHGRAVSPAGATADLCYVDGTGAVVEVSTDLALPSAEGGVSQVLDHDVAAGRSYFVRIVPSGASGSVTVKYVFLTLEKTT